jgi:hypothetical protein
VKLHFNYLTILIFFLSLSNIHAQLLVAPEKFEKEVNQELQDYDREFTYGINWNSNGALIGGVQFKYGFQHLNYQNQYHTIGLEIVGVKHPKERSVADDSTGSTYVFGKQYQLYVIRVNYGREFIIFGKAEEEGIQVSLIGAIGPSLGLQKPYYVYEGDNVRNATPKPYRPDMSFNRIYGSPGFYYGLGEMIPNLGVHIKTAINFEYGSLKSNVAGIETGMMIDFYTKKIVIIPRAENRSIFPSFFFTLYFGFR